MKRFLDWLKKRCGERHFTRSEQLSSNVMSSIDLELSDQEYRCHVTATGSAGPVSEIPCRIIIPIPGTKPPYLYLQPSSRQQYARLTAPVLRNLTGDLVDIGKNTIGKVSVDEIWPDKSEQRHHGSWEEAEISGCPIGLRIRNFNRSSENKGICSVSFWISDNELLTPAVIRMPEFSGETTIHKGESISVMLKDGMQITFETCFDSWYQENELRQKPRLVANGLSDDLSANEISSEAIDDFMLFASLAVNLRTICLGWVVSDGEGFTEYFRGDVMYPSEHKDRSYLDLLIPPEGFGKFVEHAWLKFSKCCSDWAFRRLVYVCIRDHKMPIEAELLSLFAALEDFLTAYREQQGFSEILGAEQWKELKHLIKSEIKGKFEATTSSKQRQLLYRKLDGFNRIPLEAVYDNLCEKLVIQPGDLWPVFNSMDGVSLYSVRNRLTHGGKLSNEAIFELPIAIDHLRWALQRLILASIDWPVEQSNVGLKKLRRFTSMDEWESARQRLTVLLK